MSDLKKFRIFVELLKMGRKTLTKSGKTVIGMAPELKLNPFLIPKDLRKVFENKNEPFPEMNAKEEAYLKAVEAVINKQEIEANSYVTHFKLLLYMEEYQREIEMRMYDLKDQKIGRCNNGKEFLIHVPGLAEDRPSLQMYDEVQLRKNDGTNLCVSFISFIGQKYVRIVATERFAKKYSEDHLYNIKFLLPRRTIQCCHHAIDLVNLNQLVPAMFPRERTCYNKLSKEPSWFNKNIAQNEEQKQAICNIVARTAHPAPYILFGPPGTGKTATLVEAISQIWRSYPWSRILICTPSNAAADEILKRLLKNVPEQDIHRMYGPSRNWEDVDEQIQPCSNFIDEEIIFLPKELIMLRRIVVVTLMSCARLLPLKLRENHFSYVFIDEAGQATEPETLIPLGLMSSADSSHKGRLQGQLVIAGDPMQLGPSIAVRNVDTLAISMLERLMDQCSPYMKDETGKYNPLYITKLVRNFRSHKSILHVPNNLFYDGELLACGKNEDISRAVNCPILPNKSFPLIFHAVLGLESRESNSPSVCNKKEVAVIMQYLSRLIGAKLGNRTLEKKDIGIVTPYKLQRTKIHQELERRNWDDVSVGTVEIFQGQERDVIIMSTVRSVIYKHNGKEHIGFLSNPKRFNVAVTRAKSLLITIGHPVILEYDHCWKALMSHCKENNAYIGTSFSHKLTHRQKKGLIAKKYVPKVVADVDFKFPDPEESSLLKFENCIIPENMTPKRKVRLPKIPQDLAPIPQFEFDSGITSASNSSSTEDSEQQDRASNFSSTDGNSSPAKNADSPLICDESDEPLLLATKEVANDDTSASSEQEILDNSEESSNTSDDDDAERLALALNQMILSYI